MQPARQQAMGLVPSAERSGTPAARRLRSRRRPILRNRLVTWLIANWPYLLGAVLFVVAVGVLHHVLSQFHYRDLRHALSEIGWQRILLAVAGTAGSFAALVGYEHYALDFAGRRLPLHRTALASFIAQSIAHSTGLAALVGASVRYQLYAGQGLGPIDVAKVQAFFTTTFGLGVTTLVGIVLFLEPDFLVGLVPIPQTLWRFVGILALGTVAAYLGWSWRSRRPFTILGHLIQPPRPRVTLIQIALGLMDMSAAGAALWVLLPPGLDIGYGQLLAMFVMAIVVGAVSHVPGGLGVFEGAMVLELQPPTDLSVQVIGALLVFRAIYYLLPLCLGSSLLAIIELGRWRSWLQSSGERAFRWVSLLVPTASAGLVVLAGTVLLFSGATPEIRSRLLALSILVPTPLVVVSHYACSLIGTALLFLARPLRRRVREAWTAAVMLIGAGAAFSILKGLDGKEAGLLVLLLLILLPFKAEFYRQSRLVEERLSSGWWTVAAIIVLAALWLVFFGSRHLEHGQDFFWWRASLRAEGPRSLHATLGALALLVGLTAMHLWRRRPSEPPSSTAEELAVARRVVGEAGDADARLALTGDKAFHVDSGGRAFIMYGVSGGSWIAMGEPVGPPDLWPRLIWDFHEAADRHGARTVFYDVGPRHLPLFLDLGLEVAEIGERARVPLPAFDLRGKRRADLRNARNRAAKSGIAFTVIEPEAVPAVLDDLEAISEAWLTTHGGRESGFSHGFFTRDYVASGPVAVLRRETRIIAFANLWLSADHDEASADMVRFTADAGPATMGLLMAEAMLWAKDGGYRWFDLGVAPLATPADHRLAAFWSQHGRLLLRHGAQFYDVRGLRAFMEKLDPVWEPALVLYPGRALPQALEDLGALVAEPPGSPIARR